MSLDSNWAEPKTNSQRDKEAAELYLKTHVSVKVFVLFTCNISNLGAVEVNFFCTVNASDIYEEANVECIRCI